VEIRRIPGPATDRHHFLRIPRDPRPCNAQRRRKRSEGRCACTLHGWPAQYLVDDLFFFVPLSRGAKATLFVDEVVLFDAGVRPPE